MSYLENLSSIKGYLCNRMWIRFLKSFSTIQQEVKGWFIPWKALVKLYKWLKLDYAHHAPIVTICKFYDLHTHFRRQVHLTKPLCPGRYNFSATLLSTLLKSLPESKTTSSMMFMLPSYLKNISCIAMSVIIPPAGAASVPL